MKYPLNTQKHADFILFKMVVELINDGVHLTPDGLKKIVSIRASINSGLSELLINSFPNIIPSQRPVIVDQVIKDPNWLAGFTSGDGGFFINIYKSSTSISGFSVKLLFKISQHS